MRKARIIRCVVLGGGGHAHVVIEVIRRMENVILEAVLDSDPSLRGREVSGVPILGGDEILPELKRRGISHFTLGLGSVGESRPRRAIFEIARSHGLEPLTIIHPSSICSEGATVGPGSQILPGSIVNAGARVGANVIVNSGAIIEHHCTLLDHVHVASGATLASTVHVGTGAHIGAGATVKQLLTIGEGAIVGAGAVVVNDVSPHTIVAGVPARPQEKGGRLKMPGAARGGRRV